MYALRQCRPDGVVGSVDCVHKGICGNYNGEGGTKHKNRYALGAWNKGSLREGVGWHIVKKGIQVDKAWDVGNSSSMGVSSMSMCSPKRCWIFNVVLAKVQMA
jgi:hypothetical protein